MRTNLFFPRGIRGRLFLLIGLALLPMVLLQGWIYLERYRTRKDQALQTEMEVAQGVAMTFAAYVADIRRVNAATGEAIATFERYTQQKATRLLSFNSAQSHSVRSLNWVGIDGTVLASSDPDLVGRNLSARPYFREILAGREWSLGELTPEGISTKEPTFAIATAVHEDGRLAGVVVAGLEPEGIGQLTLTLKRPGGGAYAIFDMHGHLVFRSLQPMLSWEDRVRWKESDPLLRRALETGAPQAGRVRLEVPGGEWFAARVPIPGTRWVAGAGRAAEMALAPVNDRLRRDATLAALIATAALVLAWIVARTIARPIARLEAHARAMGEGRIEPHDDRHAPAEVQRLRETVQVIAAGLVRRAEELAESDLFHRQLIDSIPGMVFTTRPDGSCDFISHQWVEFTGVPEAEQLGEGWINLLHPGDRDRAFSVWHTAVATGTPYSVEYRVRRRDGNYEWFKARGAPLRGAEGKIVRWIGICLNIDELKRTEEALRRSEERYALVSLATNDVIWDWDLRSDELLWNPALQAVFGYPPEELSKEIGWWYEHIHPDDRERVVTSIHRVVDGEDETWSAEYRFLKEDGTYASVLDRGHIHRNPEGTPLRMVGSMLDMTERLQKEEALRQSEAEFRQISDSLPLLVWVTRPDGYHEYFNRAWFEYTGTTLEDSGGDLWARLLHPDDYQKTMERWGHSLKTGDLYAIEYRFRRGCDGEYRWFLGRGTPLRKEAGDIVRWFGTCTDIHDLRRLREDLEDLVKERTAELTASNQELEAFTYSVSHDLRAPLRHITSFVELLDASAGDVLDERGRRYIRVISDAGKRLGDLIDDLLTFSRIGRASLRIVPVPLDALVGESRRELAPEMEGRTILWETGHLPQVQGDPTLLRTVLTNLLSNAVKYTRHRDPAVIVVGCEEREGEFVCYVRDNGAGFDMRYADKLFGVFQRLHKREEFEGTGIGLASVRRIIERHGGRVWAYGEVDRGATFYFSLPGKSQ